MTLVDTNVLLDIATKDPSWFPWSLEQLSVATKSGSIHFNDVIYAEFSARFDTVSEVDAILGRLGLTHLKIGTEALFLAGKAFRTYRQRGGTKTGVLSDFFIGAQAAVLSIPVLTRDAARYRSYFPDVTLIAPAENS